MRDFRNLRNVSAGFFDSCNIRVIAEAGDGIGRNIYSGSSGNGVENAGQFRGICDGDVMGNQSILAAFVIIGSDQK